MLDEIYDRGACFAADTSQGSYSRPWVQRENGKAKQGELERMGLADRWGLSMNPARIRIAIDTYTQFTMPVLYVQCLTVIVAYTVKQKNSIFMCIYIL